MYKRSITYTDFDGNQRTETFYFNLSKAELTEMALSTEGGLDVYIQKVVESRNSAEIIRIFKELILKAYGEKSDDGRRFIKHRNGVRLADEFAETEAYSTLFMELATDENRAVEFFNNIIPQEAPSLPESVTNQAK